MYRLSYARLLLKLCLRCNLREIYMGGVSPKTYVLYIHMGVSVTAIQTQFSCTAFFFLMTMMNEK